MSSGAIPQRTLGELLVEEDRATAAQVAEAEAIQERTGEFLGQILAEQGLLNADEVVSLLARHCQIPHLSLAEYEVSDELAHLIPREVCLDHHILPVDRLGKILTLGMVNPLDTAALTRVRELFPVLRIKPILCSWRDFLAAIGKLFPNIPPAEPSLDRPAVADFAAGPLVSTTNGQAAVAPGLSAGEFIQVMRDILQEAMETMSQQVRDFQGRAAAPPPVAAADQLAAILRDSVRGTIQEAMAGVTDEIRQVRAQAPPMADAPNAPENLADVMRQSVREAVQEALLAVNQETTARQEDGAMTLSGHEMAALVRHVMQETMTEMAADMRAARNPAAVVRFPALAVGD